MTEDIFDKIEGYEQLHEILNVLNKAMIECEQMHRLNSRAKVKLNFYVDSGNEIKKIVGITTEAHKEIETNTEVANIIFITESNKIRKDQ